jgi:hypothetical protein
MKQLSLSTNINNGNMAEICRINIDMKLNKNSKPILFQYIQNKLKNLNSNPKYAKSNNFDFTFEEFDHMLKKATDPEGYDFGTYNNTNIFPFCINCKIRNHIDISLQKIYFEKMIS